MLIQAQVRQRQPWPRFPRTTNHIATITFFFLVSGKNAQAFIYTLCVPLCVFLPFLCVSVLVSSIQRHTHIYRVFTELHREVISTPCAFLHYVCVKKMISLLTQNIQRLTQSCNFVFYIKKAPFKTVLFKNHFTIY